MATNSQAVVLTRDQIVLGGALIAGAALFLPGGSPGSTAGYILGAVGLFAVHQRLLTRFDATVALVTTLVVFGGTSLFWSMTHDESVLSAALFMGVAVLLFLADRKTAPRIPPKVAWLLIAATALVMRYASRHTASSAITHGWMAVLFSSSYGLLSLTPIAYLALLGTLGYFRREPARTATALLVMILWIITGADAASAGTPGPFSHNLTATLAILSPGLALVIDTARARPWIAVAPLVALAIAWNYWLMIQYTVGMLPKDAPVSFAGMVRQQADVQTRPPYVYPFAFPANVWFAWTEGLPADRYELLGHEPRRQAIDLMLDRHAVRFLMDGWEAPGADEITPLQWTRDRRATVALPLDLPADRDVLLFVTARARLEEPAIDADVGVEVNGQEIGRLVVPSSAPLEMALKIPAAAVGRIWRAGYNRLTFVSHGVRRVDPSDQRPPGPLASRAGDRAWPVAIHRIRIVPD